MKKSPVFPYRLPGECEYHCLSGLKMQVMKILSVADLPADQADRYDHLGKRAGYGKSDVAIMIFITATPAGYLRLLHAAKITGIRQ